MNTFLEILKYILPGLMVFASAYLLFKQYFEENIRVRDANIKQDKQKIILPIRMQSYERFTLFVERLSIPNLLMRLREPEMSNRQLKTALLIAIQQEFEHNVAQQIYISDTLWKIIRLAKEETQALVFAAANEVSPDGDCQELVDKIFERIESAGGSAPIEQTLMAIRTEAAAMFS